MEPHDKKEARGLYDDDLGKVQQILPNDVITTVEMVDKESYCVPKSFVDGFYGYRLWFNMPKDEAKRQHKTGDW